MIVKNEEFYLDDCLKSVKDVVDDIIIVDTGSTDKTKKIAEKYNSKIFDFEWIEDFSAARNFAIRKSQSEWIIYLDADERLSPDSKSELLRLTKDNSNFGYFCNINSVNNKGGTPGKSQYIRLFKNNKNIKFKNKVHEEIESSLKENGYEFQNSGIDILHIGYDISQGGIKQKAERNLKLLEKEYRENSNKYTAFHLGQTLVTLNRKDESIKYFLESLERNDLDDLHKAHANRFLAAYYLDKEDLKEAEKFVSAGMELNSEVPLLHLVASKLCLQQADFIKACNHAELAYELNQKELDGSVQKPFQINVNPLSLVIHNLNIALWSGNAEFFNKFKSNKELQVLSKDQKKVLQIMSILINNEAFDKSATDIPKEITEFSIELIIKLLKEYEYKDNLIDFAEEINENFQSKFLVEFIGNKALEIGNVQKAKENYELLFRQNSSDPKAILNLMNIYLAENNIVKLKEILSSAEQVFRNNPAILEKIRLIQSKLN